MAAPMYLDAKGAGPRAIVYDSHMHTPLCRHAAGEIEHYAAVALRRGLRGIVVACHNPLPDGYDQVSRMYPSQFPEYLQRVERARLKCAGRLDVRLGLECDYVPGLEDFLRRQSQSAPFDCLLGSVHPHSREYHAAYWRGDPGDFHRGYFEHLAAAAESRLFDCITHPDIVKNLYAEHWDLRRAIPEILRCLDRIAAVGTAMELNTSGLLKEIPEMNPAAPILREMSRRGIPVTVNSDAHEPGRVADHFEQAYDLLENAGYQQTCFFLQRKRHDIPIRQARESLIPAPVSAAS